VHGQIDLAKGSTTKHLANSVIADVRLWSFSWLPEWKIDMPHDRCNFLRSRWQLRELLLVLWALLYDLFGLQYLSIECLLIDIRSDLPDLLLFLLRDQRSSDLIVVIMEHLLQLLPILHLIIMEDKLLGLIFFFILISNLLEHIWCFLLYLLLVL